MSDALSVNTVRTFRSDNNAGVCDEALAAMIEAARAGHETAYGDDGATARAEAAFRSIFGDDIAIFFVATGTIANTLAIAALTRPWQRVLCHHWSHWNDDESTAPERLTGCRTTAIESGEGKLTPADIERAAVTGRGDVHQPQPGVLTISNATEFGEFYSPEETRALCETSHTLGYRVHVDGARFANAVAAGGCEARDLAGGAGVDALSFGGTKNGLAIGEAIIFFRQGDGKHFDRAKADLPYHRKSSGALLSKHRFVTAPFAATLESGAWLRHAAHANAMASELAQRLTSLGVALRFPAEANAVFAEFTPSEHAELQRRGHQYYLFGHPDWHVARLMCSFDTRADEIDALAADIADIRS